MQTRVRAVWCRTQQGEGGGAVWLGIGRTIQGAGRGIHIAKGFDFELIRIQSRDHCHVFMIAHLNIEGGASQDCNAR
jgi:hypothetical protein